MSRAWAVGGILLFLSGPARGADVSAMTDQGVAQFEKGDYNKALQTFLKIKKEDPANARVREYISKCTEKIMEKNKAERLSRAVRQGVPAAATIAEKDPVPSWAAPVRTPVPKSYPGAYQQKRRPVRSAPLVPMTVLEKEKRTSKVIAQRDQLTEEYLKKRLEGPSIRLVRKGHRVEVVAFMNRLFLPFSDAFAPDAVPALDALLRELSAEPGKTTILRAIDSLTPAVRHQMLDLPARRVSILFSALLHTTLGTKAKDERGTFTATDLDD